ncbi:Redoxin domain protein [Pirellula staleyi DSM 6068]|uniref:Redoxin domain protein n=1 Tax=Pirellula staleyi (strain ATCC 27377 / DSM 6068 / ICPB 4128) TaxID=530564 RepID=D2QXH2_PIRSD|nr:TlpA disulfide reductase family protein [Pirellula staleyi]ADB16157.1 Redoxin domain protein [Pirellula staleyi DSM 6068]
MSRRAIQTPANGQRITLWAIVGCVAMLSLVSCAKQNETKSSGPKYRPEGEPGEVASSSPGSEEPASETPVADPAAEPTIPTAAGPKLKYPVPAGSNAELLGYIDSMSKRQPQGASREETVADYIDIQASRLSAAEQVIASKPSAEERIRAFQAIHDVYRTRSTLQLPGARQELQDFATKLSKDADKEVARFGRIITFDMNVSALAQEGPDNAPQIVDQVKQLIAVDKQELDTLILCSQVCEVLAQMGAREETISALKMVSEAFKDHPDERARNQAAMMADRAVVVEFDLGNKAADMVTGAPNAEENLLKGVDGLLKHPNLTPAIYEAVREVAQMMEYSSNIEVAAKLYDKIDTAFAAHPDEKLQAAVKEASGNAKKRVSLIGQPFEIEGNTLDGKPFDMSTLAGKVVLIDFWATWCGPCLEEIPNIEQNFQAFKDSGFAVVGINLNEKLEEVTEFFGVQELPWPTVISASDDSRGFDHPTARKCGVDAIPFIVLIGKDGKVDSIHVRGPKLKTKLTQLLGAPAAPASEPLAEPPAETPAAETPAATPAEKPATETPAETSPPVAPAPEEKPAEPTAPAAEEKQVSHSGARGRTSMFSWLESRLLLTSLLADEASEAKSPEAVDPAADFNPYAAKPGLASDALVDYLFRMLDKPKTIQLRSGFSEALLDACDRILAADPAAKPTEQLVALETKFQTLHAMACRGDVAADEKLAVMVEKYAADERPRVVKQVKFFQLEKKILAAAEIDIAELEASLETIAQELADEKMTASHLRLASATVAAINRIENGETREKYFQSFGNLFVKSSDKELSRYGKKLAKKPAAKESDLVGKPLELVGTTAGGEAFAWDAYRGKVVLVDFWATWCGPCRKEMPNVKQLHERLGKDGFDVVGISLDKDLEALAGYLETETIPWTTLAGDETQGLAEKYGVRGIPTMMVVDKQGNVAGVAHNVAALAPIIEKLLAEK